MTYRLEAKAVPVWNKWHLQIEQLILKEASPILRSTYPKTRERAARLALVIHLIDAVMVGTAPAERISVATLERAIGFTRWLMGQTRLLYAEFGIVDNPETAKILKFVNRFRGCGWVTTKQVRNWYPSREKPNFEECRKFMAKVVTLGYAKGNDKQGSDYQIEISKPVVTVVTNPLEASNSNGSSSDEDVVTDVVTVVTPSPPSSPAGSISDESDEPSDEDVVTAETITERELQPPVTTVTTDLEDLKKRLLSCNTLEELQALKQSSEESLLKKVYNQLSRAEKTRIKDISRKDAA